MISNNDWFLTFPEDACFVKFIGQIFFSPSPRCFQVFKKNLKTFNDFLHTTNYRKRCWMKSSELKMIPIAAHFLASQVASRDGDLFLRSDSIWILARVFSLTDRTWSWGWKQCHLIITYLGLFICPSLSLSLWFFINNRKCTFQSNDVENEFPIDLWCCRRFFWPLLLYFLFSFRLI